MDPPSDVRTVEPAAEPARMSRRQTLTLISMASVNFSSMLCYSILGPFFPNEAVKKGASQTVVGLIFGCYAICNLIGSLVLGRYIVQIGTKFMLVAGLFVSSGCTIMFGLLDRAPAGPTFIALCFIVRSVDAVGFAAAMTSTFAMTAKIFPNNVATVLGSLEIFTGLGLILGPPVGGWFYHSFGYEVPFMLLGCLLLVMVPFNIYVLPSIEADPSKDSFLRLLGHIKVLLICFVIFTLSSGLGFFDATLSLFAMKTYNLSPGYVGLIMLGLSLPYCLASPLIGYFTDKYPVSTKATNLSRTPLPLNSGLSELQDRVYADWWHSHSAGVLSPRSGTVPSHSKSAVAAGSYAGDNRLFSGNDHHSHLPGDHRLCSGEGPGGGAQHSGDGLRPFRCLLVDGVSGSTSTPHAFDVSASERLSLAACFTAPSWVALSANILASSGLPPSRGAWAFWLPSSWGGTPSVSADGGAHSRQKIACLC